MAHASSGPGDGPRRHGLHGPQGPPGPQDCLAFALPDDDRRVDGDAPRLPGVTLCALLPRDLALTLAARALVPCAAPEGGGESERWRHRALRCVRLQV